MKDRQIYFRIRVSKQILYFHKSNYIHIKSDKQVQSQWKKKEISVKINQTFFLWIFIVCHKMENPIKFAYNKL